MVYRSSEQIQKQIDELNKKLAEAKARENVHFVSDQLIERLKAVLKSKNVFLTPGEIGHVVDPLRRIEDERFRLSQKKKESNNKYRNKQEQENV